MAFDAPYMVKATRDTLAVFTVEAAKMFTIQIGSIW